MTDPYEVLNVPNTATDEEVKKAYHALARKYHPDNYHNNPLADLAQEKMKEINAAYDAIQRERNGRSSVSGGGYAQQSYGGAAARAQQGAYRRQQYQEPSPEAQILHQVRLMIIMGGSLEQAERLLAQIMEPNRNGEWHFLMGQICYRRGWIDEARRYYQTACAEEPDNMEYHEALANLSQTRAAYRPEGYHMSSTCGGGELCRQMACMYMICNLGGCFYCC